MEKKKIEEPFPFDPFFLFVVGRRIGMGKKSLKPPSVRKQGSEKSGMKSLILFGLVGLVCVGLAIGVSMNQKPAV